MIMRKGGRPPFFMIYINNFEMERGEIILRDENGVYACGTEKRTEYCDILN